MMGTSRWSKLRGDCRSGGSRKACQCRRGGREEEVVVGPRTRFRRGAGARCLLHPPSSSPPPPPGPPPAAPAARTPGEAGGRARCLGGPGLRALRWVWAWGVGKRKQKRSDASPRHLTWARHTHSFARSHPLSPGRGVWPRAAGTGELQRFFTSPAMGALPPPTGPSVRVSLWGRRQARASRIKKDETAGAGGGGGGLSFTQPPLSPFTFTRSPSRAAATATWTRFTRPSWPSTPRAPRPPRRPRPSPSSSSAETSRLSATRPTWPASPARPSTGSSKASTGTTAGRRPHPC